MKIIIVGCGNVGVTLAEQLSKEGNDICVIDSQKQIVEEVISKNDIMGICGNGSNYSVLMEAGITSADILIAVTESDEMNLLCCVIAQKAGHCKLIARVRNPIYETETDFLRKELSLSMILNPDKLTAQEIFQVLCFPTAKEIAAFEGGKVQMIRYCIPEDSAMCNLLLKNMTGEEYAGILINAVERNGEVFIPNGDTKLCAGDMISIVGTRKTIAHMMTVLKDNVDAVKNVLIAGGSRVSVYLAKMLASIGVKVKIIEKDAEKCDSLTDTLPKATIICGDGGDLELLHEERAENMDSYVALTKFDEENIMLSLQAMKLVKKKVVTKIKRSQLKDVMKELDLDSVVYPKNLTADRIIRYVRSARKHEAGSKIKNLFKMYDDRAEALEFEIGEEKKLINIPLYKLGLKKGILIASITRDGKTFIPKGQDEIHPKDTIIVFTTVLGIKEAQDILG